MLQKIIPASLSLYSHSPLLPCTRPSKSTNSPWIQLPFMSWCFDLQEKWSGYFVIHIANSLSEEISVRGPGDNKHLLITKSIKTTKLLMLLHYEIDLAKFKVTDDCSVFPLICLLSNILVGYKMFFFLVTQIPFHTSRCCAKSVEKWKSESNIYDLIHSKLVAWSKRYITSTLDINQLFWIKDCDTGWIWFARWDVLVVRSKHYRFHNLSFPIPWYFCKLWSRGHLRQQATGSMH